MNEKKEFGNKKKKTQLNGEKRFYLLTAIGCAAALVAKPFGKYRLAGYCTGAVTVCLIRFASSFLSGVILWGSYKPEGMNVWIYSLIYNTSYMLPNAILTGIFAVVVCAAIDPTTLKPMK